MTSTKLRLTHLSLGVANLDVSEKFYREVLDLPVQRVDDHVEVRWNDFLLILTSSPPAGRGKFHFGFRVETKAEVDAWGKRLRELGVDIVIGPSGEGSLRQLYCIDPDDYKIEIYSEEA